MMCESADEIIIPDDLIFDLHIYAFAHLHI
jgi:hypothetical protein